ncbi:hypothetical protein SAMN05421809_0394 [Natronorubrum daqingense]|uniref:Uncharacterized protein n=1 Tax=Natronorubrum daqingense TaxID=588898 RepID=A0A1N6YC10_9EURY|nr:hypothetical protein SAMN05421809_0394 [Natronorubrum daqingense]
MSQNSGRLKTFLTLPSSRTQYEILLYINSKEV